MWKFWIVFLYGVIWLENPVLDSNFTQISQFPNYASLKKHSIDNIEFSDINDIFEVVILLIILQKQSIKRAIEVARAQISCC